MFLFYFYTLLQKNTNPKSHFSNIINHISNFSGKGTIPAQATGLPPKPVKQPNIRQAAHNIQATGQPGMQRAKMKNPPLGQGGNRTRSFYPAALVDQTSDRNTVHPGIGGTEDNGNMQDARRCSFEFRFSDCKSGKNSDVVSRPAKNSYGFFSRSRSECPDFFPTFVTNKSINTFYIDTMEFEGTVYKIMPVTKGTSARGDWQRQDVVFEMNEGSFARKICVTFFNKPEDVARLKEGAAYTVSVNIESREYNGRWYTDIRAWRLQPKQETAAAPMPDMPPIAEEPSYASSPAQVDDLPF